MRTGDLQLHGMVLVNDVAVVVDVIAIGIHKVFGCGDLFYAAEKQSRLLGRDLDAHRVAVAVVVAEAAQHGSATFHDLADHHLHLQCHASALDGVVAVACVKHERLDIDLRRRAVGEQQRVDTVVPVPSVGAPVNACERGDAPPVGRGGLPVAAPCRRQLGMVAYGFAFRHARCGIDGDAECPIGRYRAIA